jgi:hypothetical protein
MVALLRLKPPKQPEKPTRTRAVDLLRTKKTVGLSAQLPKRSGQCHCRARHESTEQTEPGQRKPHPLFYEENDCVDGLLWLFLHDPMTRIGDDGTLHIRRDVAQFSLH